MTTEQYEFPLNVIHFLLDMPAEAAFWLACAVAVFFLTAGFLAYLQRRPTRTRRRRRVPSWLSDRLHARARRAAEANELRRYAEEVAVAAARAMVTAQRRRADWLTAHAEAGATWQAFEAADAAADRAMAAAVFDAAQTPGAPADEAERARYLRQAASSAFWRGELSAPQLCDAMAHRNGWDPRRHPFEQEVFLRQVIRDEHLARHRAAAEREQAAWREAELASAAARSLRDEAYAAAQRAEQAGRGTAPARRRPQLSITAGRARTPATNAVQAAAGPGRRLRTRPGRLTARAVRAG